MKNNRQPDSTNKKIPRLNSVRVHIKDLFLLLYDLMAVTVAFFLHFGSDLIVDLLKYPIIT